jgi:hypothetical protein
MNTEKWLKQLEDESKALKQVFDRSALSMTIFTKTASISTSQNKITVTYPDGSTDSFNDQERIVVTFNTKTGANTLAKLEYTTTSPFIPIKRLQTYSGGARWMLSNNPNINNSGQWTSAKYDITVQSFLDGTLSVAEATS